MRGMADDDELVEAQPLTEENLKWQASLAGLRAIMYDPNETEERKKKAHDVWRKATQGGPLSSVGYHIGENRSVGNHRGGKFLRTTIDYQGETTEW